MGNDWGGGGGCMLSMLDYHNPHLHAKVAQKVAGLDAVHIGILANTSFHNI
jgi:hypothetical protein